MYIQRTVQQALKDLTKSFPCVVVYGPRQVGKSTTINFTFGGEYPQVTLDDVEDRALAQSNPRLFLETYQWPLIIDEIQKAPLLLEEIKKIIDSQRLLWLKEGKERQLMYILTGSNRFELQQGISDSLAGRCGIIEMDSFSQAERYQQVASVFSPSIQELLQKERKSSIPMIAVGSTLMVALTSSTMRSDTNIYATHTRAAIKAPTLIALPLNSR